VLFDQIGKTQQDPLALGRQFSGPAAGDKARQPDITAIDIRDAGIGG
jgi:hypothetical protein